MKFVMSAQLTDCRVVGKSEHSDAKHRKSYGGKPVGSFMRGALLKVKALLRHTTLRYLRSTNCIIQIPGNWDLGFILTLTFQLTLYHLFRSQQQGIGVTGTGGWM